MQLLVSLGVGVTIWLLYPMLPCLVPAAVPCDAHPIRPPPRMNASCPITWVTAYFRSPSKHSFHEYNEWIQNLQAIQMCLVVYTDASDLWSSHSATTVVIPTNLCSVTEWHVNLTQRDWQWEFSKDSNCHKHQHYQVYWVWAMKAFFLNTTAVADPFGSETFFWLDSGYFRDHRHNGRDVRTTRTPLVRADAVTFLQIYPFAEVRSACAPKAAHRHMS
jgi:hypothetical protein